MSLLPEPLEIDSAFVSRAREGRRPEKRFRFTSRCAESDCKQWSEGRCSVADRILAAGDLGAEALPACGIRDSCRWIHQSGPDACRACSYVVTDSVARRPSN